MDNEIKYFAYLFRWGQSVPRTSIVFNRTDFREPFQPYDIPAFIFSAERYKYRIGYARIGIDSNGMYAMCTFGNTPALDKKELEQAIKENRIGLDWGCIERDPKYPDKMSIMDIQIYMMEEKLNGKISGQA